MFHSLDSAVNVVKFALDPLDGRFPGVCIGLIKFLIGFILKGDDRFHFQDQTGMDEYMIGIDYESIQATVLNHEYFQPGRA